MTESSYVPNPPSTETQIALLRMEVHSLSKDVTALTKSTSELVDAWKAANKLVTFIKWLAGLSTALAAFWAVLSHYYYGR